MFADAVAVTVLVVTGKVAVLDPAETVTLCGTLTSAGLVLTRPTLAPCGGAGPLTVTTPCAEDPPITLAEFTVTDDTPSDPPLEVTESNVA